MVSYYVGEVGPDSYKGIAPEVDYNHVRMLVVDFVVNYIRDPSPVLMTSSPALRVLVCELSTIIRIISPRSSTSTSTSSST